MKKFKARFISDNGVFGGDVIEWQNELWLVPIWIVDETAGIEEPARLVCLSRLPHQRAAPGDSVDFVVNNPIPKSILDGKPAGQDEFDYCIVDNRGFDGSQSFH